jgi:Zn-dependent membrane protease YugP
MFGYFLYGPSLLILLPAIALAVYAQWKVRSTYSRYARIAAASGLTAGDTARRILENAGVSGVTFDRVERRLGDHYDPGKRILSLSDPDSASIAAIGVAAHEAGHAVQHARGFAPMALRSAIVPIANFGSQLAFPLFFVGLIFRSDPLITVGILLFSAAVLFTLVTLPVEFDASRRAVASLRETGIVTSEELGGVKEVLFAAALTYVAAAAVAALQLLLLLSAGRRK